MIRYIKQRDKYSCGPVAIMNVLKWAGAEFSYQGKIKLFQQLCFCKPSNGTSHASLNYSRPPRQWKPTIYTGFFGRFIRSGILKKSGEGTDKVAWTVELENTGRYDIYFHNEGSLVRGRGRGNRGRRARYTPGKKHFQIHHEDGTEEITIDLGGAEEGWNYLGTFQFAAGLNRIELSDKNESVYVTADAIKLIRR